jgi:hypothetical protein
VVQGQALPSGGQDQTTHDMFYAQQQQEVGLPIVCAWHARMLTSDPGFSTSAKQQPTGNNKKSARRKRTRAASCSRQPRRCCRSPPLPPGPFYCFA